MSRIVMLSEVKHLASGRQSMELQGGRVVAGRGYICQVCGRMRTLSPDIAARFPGWVPTRCLDCGDRPRTVKVASQPQLSRSEVLAQYTDGPQTGVFTDGFCEPNPGQGGWGAVKVTDGEIVEERHGREEDTTNNRMELKALIEGYRMLGPDEDMTIFSDSALCVNIATQWAEAWKSNGWTRGKKREEVKNLDLVMELYELAVRRPSAKAEWIKGHAGSRWNEYADALSRVSLEDSPNR